MEGRKDMEEQTEQLWRVVDISQVVESRHLQCDVMRASYGNCEQRYKTPWRMTLEL